MSLAALAARKEGTPVTVTVVVGAARSPLAVGHQPREGDTMSKKHPRSAATAKVAEFKPAEPRGVEPAGPATPRELSETSGVPEPAGTPQASPEPIRCRHCHERKVCRPRGLCWRCYYAPGVRDQYPPQPGGRQRWNHYVRNEEAIRQMVEKLRKDRQEFEKRNTRRRRVTHPAS